MLEREVPPPRFPARPAPVHISADYCNMPQLIHVCRTVCLLHLSDLSDTQQEPVTVFVPDSCCALNGVWDTRLYDVDPQKPPLKDPLRCQQDAEGKISNSGNVHNTVRFKYCIKCIVKLMKC